jgi:putative flippase GtrA
MLHAESRTLRGSSTPGFQRSAFAHRWLMFNGVGVLGFAVQLAALAVLTHGAGWHYLLATAVAVEAALLHNFLWHQRLTWRERRTSDAHESWRRLGRFHLLNGGVSLAGNLVLMALLAGQLGMPPVAANVLAVLMCSIVNFVGSEVLVFKKRGDAAAQTKPGLTAALVLIAIALPAGPHGGLQAEELAGAHLRAGTLAAWQQYENGVDAVYRQAGSAGPFFRHDAFTRDPQWRRQAQGGAIVMFAADRPSPAASSVDVPDGRIHHWVGAVFVPGATLGGVLGTLRANAGRESESYPDVLDSRLLARDGDRVRVFMKIERDAPLITVTYNTEHDVEYRRLSPARASSRSAAVKIAELSKAGTPQEQEKPPGRDSGFLWRLNAYWRYEEIAGGVLIECESVSLSRDIPFVVRPLVTGAVNRIARESLETTLRTLRDVLVQR